MALREPVHASNWIVEVLAAATLKGLNAAVSRMMITGSKLRDAKASWSGNDPWKVIARCTNNSLDSR
jgi:hypothetical protein